MADRSPYVGPRPFSTNDTDLFFGRERDAKELYASVVSHPLTLLYSQSGAGKTSLIHAGLLSLLEENGHEVLRPVRVVELAADDEARVADNVFVDRVLAGLRGGRTPEDLGGADNPSSSGVAANEPKGELARYLRSLLSRAVLDELGQPRQPDRLRIIILDQVEELFLDVRHWEHRRGFFEEIAEAIELDDNLRLLLAIREEYLAELDAYARLIPERQWARFRLERLRKPAALDAVTKPLEHVEPRRTFEKGVAEELVDALAVEIEMSRAPVRTGWWPRRRSQPETIPGEQVEPVHLQVVCEKLWKTLRDDEKTITRKHYEVANPDAALADLYEGAVKAASRRSARVWQWQVRRWVGRKLITPAGTRCPVFRGDKKSAGLSNRTVKVLEDEHIVRGEKRAGAYWYELTHDRLIQPILASNRRYRRPRLVGLVALVGIAIGAAVGGSVVYASESGAALLTPSLDFGPVPINRFDDKRITLNTRSTPLIITAIKIDSDEFETISGCERELPAHIICRITVLFQPRTKGSKIAVLQIARKDGPPLTSTLTGIGS